LWPNTCQRLLCVTRQDTRKRRTGISQAYEFNRENRKGRKGKGTETSNLEAMRARKQSNSEGQFLVFWIPDSLLTFPAFLFS
jgi:hypothetical protein